MTKVMANIPTLLKAYLGLAGASPSVNRRTQYQSNTQ